MTTRRKMRGRIPSPQTGSAAELKTEDMNGNKPPSGKDKSTIGVAHGEENQNPVKSNETAPKIPIQGNDQEKENDDPDRENDGEATPHP